MYAIWNGMTLISVYRGPLWYYLVFFGRGDFWESDLQERFFKYQYYFTTKPLHFLFTLFITYIFNQAKYKRCIQVIQIIHETKKIYEE